MTPKVHIKLFQKAELVKIDTKISIMKAVEIVNKIPYETVKSFFVVQAYKLKAENIAKLKIHIYLASLQQQ